jgi:hypothetical protein
LIASAIITSRGSSRFLSNGSIANLTAFAGQITFRTARE